jgi:hypothetical protein
VVDAPETPTQHNLTKIGIAYLQFSMKKRRPPAGPDDLLPLLKESGCDPDKVFMSDRDHQPLVICWGVDTRAFLASANSTPVLGYEKQGVNGSRYVLTQIQGIVQLMSEKEFRAASFPPGYAPDS